MLGGSLTGHVNCSFTIQLGEEVFPLVAIAMMSKRNKFFAHYNSKLVLHSHHKLIGYWRLK